jgi:hypothetical protein
MYTEFILSEAGGKMEVPITRECERGMTQGFFSNAVCSSLANPIAGIIYKNNQVMTLGLNMMGLPSFITGTNSSKEYQSLDASGNRILPSEASVAQNSVSAPSGTNSDIIIKKPGGSPDIGLMFFSFIVGLIIAITFFLSGLYLASILLQSILNFFFEIMIFPMKTFKFVMQGDSYANVWPAVEGVVGSIKNLVITMIVAGIMSLVNVILIISMFGTSGMNVGAESWSDKFMLLLSSIVCLLIMTRLFNISKEKITKYGAKTDEAFYKQLTENAQAIGKVGVNVAGNLKKTIMNEKKTTT